MPVVTLTERKIAYIAIMPRTGMDGAQLMDDIAQEAKKLRIDLSGDELVAMLADLISRNVITMRASPARNVNSTEPNRTVTAWYEKGMDWPPHMSFEEIIEELKERRRRFGRNSIQDALQLLSADGRLMTLQQAEKLLDDEYQADDKK